MEILERLAFNAYYASVLARGIIVAQNKSKYVSNKFESAKDLAETSMLFVSNWGNLASGFKFLVGERFEQSLLFSPARWYPSMKKRILHFMQKQSLSQSLSTIFMNLVTLSGVIALLRSFSLLKAAIFILGLFIQPQSMDIAFISSWIVKALDLFTNYYAKMMTFFSENHSEKKDETLVEKVNSVIELKQSIVSKLTDTTKYTLPHHYIEFKHNILPTLYLFMSRVAEQAIYVLLPFFAIGVSNEDYVHWLAKL